MVEIFGRGQIIQLDPLIVPKMNDDITYFSLHSKYGRYAGRGQTDLPTMQRQNRVGKKGEFITQKLLVDQYGYPPAVEPDMKIYLPHEKTYDPDLPYHKFDSSYRNVHVKTCAIDGNEFPMSWMFQFASDAESGGDVDRLFLSSKYDKELIAFIIVHNEYADRGLVAGIMTWFDVKTVGGCGLLQPPVAKRLLPYKKCVYDAGIEEMIRDLGLQIQIAA